jgi:hypothetical protein
MGAWLFPTPNTTLWQNNNPSPAPAAAPAPLPASPADYASTPGDGLKAELFLRTQYVRTVGFQGFIANKPFVVSDGVPKGKVRFFLALSAYRTSGTGRILHFFAVPPQDADALVNPLTDSVGSIFLGALNNPPLRSGVLLSTGGNSTVNEQQSVSAGSVNGLLQPFILPERWKILCFVDSGEAALGTADGITLDMAVADFDYCECLPDAFA